jgi:DNA polymerase-3 subunit epsilon
MHRKSAHYELIDLVDVPFVAIDFETADRYADSACAVGLVRVEHGRIVRRQMRFIRPPRSMFEYTGIHGITWEDVSGEPEFGEVWPELEGMLDGARFLAAHNAPFDRKVLYACCTRSGLQPPPQRFVCTVQLARRVWQLPSARLPDVCEYLGVRLKHHQALSDAEGCARIVMSAAQIGAAQDSYARVVSE